MQQTFPVGSVCNVGPDFDGWFIEKDMICHKYSRDKFPKVVIIGAGISGLTVAYEMVRAWKLSRTIENKDDKLEIDIYEKSSYAGGKIVGYFNVLGRPIEHSTRVYTVGYVALFDILKNIPSINQVGPRYKLNRDGFEDPNARCVLDDLVPMYTNYIDIQTHTSHFTNQQNISPYKLSFYLMHRYLKKI